MPKNILKINRFEGGINSNADPKDLDAAEVAAATDCYFGKIGQISSVGLATTVSNIQTLGDSALTAGYGLTSFKSNHSINNASLASYTSWEVTNQTSGTNGEWPFFNINVGDFHGHPLTDSSETSSIYNAWISNMAGDAATPLGYDPFTCRDNWGLRIHIGTTLGTPLKSWPLSTESAGESGFTSVSAGNGLTKTIKYHIIEKDGSMWMQLLPEIGSRVRYETESGSNSYNVSKFYWFDHHGHNGYNLRWSVGNIWDEGPNSYNYQLYSDGPAYADFSWNPKSNFLLTLAAIINQDLETTVTVEGEEDNYSSIHVKVNPEATGNDYTPANYYMWVEYRHYADNNFANLPNNTYSTVNSIASNDFDGIPGHKDYNFLSIPQMYDTDHPAYGSTLSAINTSDYQLQSDLTNNSAVTNLVSDGWVLITQNLSEYLLQTNFPHTTRRVMNGIDLQAFNYTVKLKESDGGDNAVNGEVYGLELSGPNITDVKKVEAPYIATSADQLTEIIDDLEPLIEAAYGSEKVTNGDMSASADMTATGWTVSGGVATASSGTTYLDNIIQNKVADHPLSLDASTYYKVEVDVTITSGTLYVDLGDNTRGNAQNTNVSGNNQIFIIKTPGTVSGDAVRFYGGTFRGTIDNVSVKEVTGGVGGIAVTQPESNTLSISTSGTGQNADYEIRPFIDKALNFEYKSEQVELLAHIDNQSDLYLCNVADGIWTSTFNNNNEHKVISSVASGGGSLTTVNCTAHGFSNSDVVKIKGTKYTDGIHVVDNVSTNSFTVPVTWAADIPYANEISRTVTKLDTTEFISAVNDRTFAGASNWANAAGSNAFNAYNEEDSGKLTVTPDDDGSNRQYATLDGAYFSEQNMVTGNRYRLTYTLTISAYTKGTLSIGTCNDAFAIQDSNTYTATAVEDSYTLDFTYDSDCDKIIIDAATSTVLTASIDNVSIRELSMTSVNNDRTLIWPHSGAKPQYYNDKGILRMSDTVFDNRDNKPSWVGYISKELFNTANTTTKSVELEGWFVKDQHKKFASTPTDWVNADWLVGNVNAAENSGKMHLDISWAGSGSSDWRIESTGYKFYLTALFDDGTETVPDFNNTQGLVYYDGSSTYVSSPGGSDALQINIGIDAMTSEGLYAFDERMRGFRLYMGLSSEDYGELYEVGTIDFKDGFIRGDNGGTTAWGALGSDASTHAATTGQITIADFFRGNTYVLNTGYPYEDTLIPEVKWKTGVIVRNTAFIGNLEYDDGYGKKRFPGQLMTSVFGKPDTFLYPDSVLDFVGDNSEEIIKLEAFADRLLQFKESSVLIINISNLGDEFVEEEHRWKGISSPNHVVWTAEGVIWANEYSVYIYDGNDVKDLMITKQGTFKDNRSIGRSDWSSFFSNNSLVIYEPVENQVIVKRSVTSNSTHSNGDIYLLDLDGGGWSFGRGRFINTSPTDNPMQSNAITLSDGSIYMLTSFTNNTGRFRNWGVIAEAGLPVTKSPT